MIKSDYCSSKSQYLQLKWFINVIHYFLCTLLTKYLSFVFDNNSLILLTHILFKIIQIINKRENYNIINYSYQQKQLLVI